MTYRILIAWAFWSVAITSTAIFAAGEDATNSAKPKSVATRHLFLDPGFLESIAGAELAVNPAQQREIVIKADRPWEKRMISLFLTVRDEGDKLRMWYICRDADNQPNVAYAESVDGIHWDKPNLGIVDYHGSTDNNLVGLQSLEGVVYRDPKATSPEAQYVYVTNLKTQGVTRFISPDGLHWTQSGDVLLPFSVDTQCVTFWDEPLQKYVIYFRGWTQGERWQDRLRTVKRVTTDDLTKSLGIVPSGNEEAPGRSGVRSHVSDELPTILAADEQDPENSDIYNMSVQPYPLAPEWHVAFPSFLMRERNLIDGRLEVQFTASKDGENWFRYNREPYAKPGLTGTPNANMVYFGTGLVLRENEIWHYGVGLHTRHGDMASRIKNTDGTIYRYTQRLDGFVSLDFERAGGECRTAPVNVEGDKLILNVDTAALGHLQVGLVGADGHPIKGFEIENCSPLRINSLDAVVHWEGDPDLGALRDQSVRLAIRGARSKLFSFRFE